MSPHPGLPLNEPQKRHITVALATVERHLAELQERLDRRPLDSRLVRHEDPLSADEAEQLLPLIAQAESVLRRIADDLRLEPQVEPGRRTHSAALEIAAIHLHECTAEGGLANYGAVAPATALYLQRELPKLDAAVQCLLQQLSKPLQLRDAQPP